LYISTYDQLTPNRLHVVVDKCQLVSAQEFQKKFKGKPNMVDKVFFFSQGFDLTNGNVFYPTVKDVLKGPSFLVEKYNGVASSKPKLLKHKEVVYKEENLNADGEVISSESDSGSGSSSEFDSDDHESEGEDELMEEAMDVEMEYHSMDEAPSRTPSPPPSPPKRTAAQVFARPKKFQKTKVNILASDPAPKRSRARHEAQNEYELAREKLHVSAIPDSLPCREEEFAEVTSYLEDAISDNSGCCIYISGVPGTGKTATVTHVIKSLQQRVEEKDLRSFSYCEINGMKLTEPSQAYVVLWQHLTGERVAPHHAQQLLGQHFSKPNRQDPIVVLMDELDQMVTKKQDVMYNFFDWPNLPNSRLIVVAVANTMDLPERMLANRVTSRMGLTRMNFLPYNNEQIVEIVKARLTGLSIFDEHAIGYVATKISGTSGDCRRVLDICRRAVELVQGRMKREGTSGLKVLIETITYAVKEMYDSPLQVFLSRASLQQKVLLIALMNRVRKAGIDEVIYKDVCILRVFANFSKR
jgi:Cdc6-like AAA superfamily ATPase